MGYECDCGWTSGPDSDGKTMPQYNFVRVDGTQKQIAHCPECAAILSERENNTHPIG